MSYCRRASAPAAAEREAGAALIVAIFIMAVAVSMMIALSLDSIIAARRAENQVLADQAWLYLTGAEQLAAEMIRLRIKELDEEESEAGTLRSLDVVGQFPTDDGWLSFTVEDLQGRFNLNTLRSDFVGAAAGSQSGDKEEAPSDSESGTQSDDKTAASAAAVAPGDVARTVPQHRFIRLLRSVGETPMSEAEATEVLEAIQDWIDADVLETGFGGAEQSHYAQQETPYRPADGPLRDISELRLIKGISAELYNALRPLVTVWPVEGSAINVASVGPIVMGALYHNPDRLAEPLAPQSAEVLVAAVQEQEITTMEDLLARPEWGPDPLPGKALGASSEVFLVFSQAQVGRLRQGLQSVVLVKDNKTRILARSLTML